MNPVSEPPLTPSSPPAEATLAPRKPQQAAAGRVSREKTAGWLRETKSTETTQAIALRLLLDVRTGKSADQLQSGIDRLLGLRNSDGSWNQVKDIAGVKDFQSAMPKAKVERSLKSVSGPVS